MGRSGLSLGCLIREYRLACAPRAIRRRRTIAVTQKRVTMKVMLAAALSAASLQTIAATITYRTCKLENGVTVLHDGNCEELIRSRKAQRERSLSAEQIKQVEAQRLQHEADQQRLKEDERNRSESHEALKDCLRFGRCRFNQYAYHLTRVQRSDVQQLLGEPAWTHTFRQATYNYYKVPAEGRRALLQLEIVGTRIAGVKAVW